MGIPYPIYDLLFLDVETVSAYPTYDDVPEFEQGLWKEKAKYWMKDVEDQEEGARLAYGARAAILAEFGQVVCISMGFLAKGNRPEEDVLRIKSWYGTDEKAILTPFSTVLESHFGNPMSHMLCGHNIREFDVPYLCRRMLMQGMPLPPMLDVAGKRPWQLKHILDTLELWKFGDIKHYISLKLLTHCLGIDSPKSDISGADVGRLYYEDNDLDGLARYCEGDVLAVAQVMRKLCKQPLLNADQVTKAG